MPPAFAFQCNVHVLKNERGRMELEKRGQMLAALHRRRLRWVEAASRQASASLLQGCLCMQMASDFHQQDSSQEGASDASLEGDSEDPSVSGSGSGRQDGAASHSRRAAGGKRSARPTRAQRCASMRTALQQLWAAAACTRLFASHAGVRSWKSRPAQKRRGAAASRGPFPRMHWSSTMHSDFEEAVQKLGERSILLCCRQLPQHSQLLRQVCPAQLSHQRSLLQAAPFLPPPRPFWI
jgi:hypothetical protein